MRVPSLSFLAVACLVGSGQLLAAEPLGAVSGPGAEGAAAMAMKNEVVAKAAEGSPAPLASPLIHEPAVSVNAPLIPPSTGAVTYGEPGICPVITDIVADICAQSPSEPYCQQ